ncbi:hypothetical protein KSP35_13990 [Aquihabitans sp. G128]|uniref:hypothetical protein n=1 Tax=Aquihabitans sp. G128 TaxID=2849779 RepID=UPI001C22D2B9|nr:hypothetical protein [Aquihabitans sp. G128]QXC59502.1 hypothetical protein KSP35_13990 [Aquihabitans sp. G128]
MENGATVLAAECMAKLGFNYEPTLVPVERGANPFGAGDLDPARTKTEGYGDIVGGSALDPSASPIQKYEDALPPAERSEFHKAFMGTKRQEVEVEGGGFSVPKDGCLAQGREVIGGDAFVEWSSARAAIEEATGQATAAFEESDEWTKAEKRWSRCMAEDGYHYASNGEAIGDALAKFGKEGAMGEARTVSQVEVDMATTDATCRRSAKFNETIVKVQGPLEQKAMTSVEGPILAWMDSRDAVLAKAEDALRTGGGG